MSTNLQIKLKAKIRFKQVLLSNKSIPLLSFQKIIGHLSFINTLKYFLFAFRHTEDFKLR